MRIRYDSHDFAGELERYSRDDVEGVYKRCWSLKNLKRSGPQTALVLRKHGRRVALLICLTWAVALMISSRTSNTLSGPPGFKGENSRSSTSLSHSHAASIRFRGPRGLLPGSKKGLIKNRDGKGRPEYRLSAGHNLLRAMSSARADSMDLKLSPMSRPFSTPSLSKLAIRDIKCQSLTGRSPNAVLCTFSGPGQQDRSKRQKILFAFAEKSPSEDIAGVSEELLPAIDGLVEGESVDQVDLFRETPLRYLGYANEVGEAFRVFIGPGGVLGSYMVASGYVVSDSVYQGIKKAKEQPDEVPENIRNARVIAAGMESLVWQSFASVILPGFTINRSVALAHFFLLHLYKSPLWDGVSPDITTRVDHWGPTLFGLAVIPLIVRPIDSSVEKAFQKYVRPSIDEFLKNYEARYE
mmetsp:Transcript_11795/g.16466  ORF Transcript_11795/g.16466 Transcript_11795/m.16466 type:complete len:411 (+) Transcript_11795:301-1533(+)